MGQTNWTPAKDGRTSGVAEEDSCSSCTQNSEVSLWESKAAIKSTTRLQCLKTVTSVISNVWDEDLGQWGRAEGLIDLKRQTKSAHPPAMDQPIVWGVQLIPSLLKNVVSSTATAFSAGHSGRGMREGLGKGGVRAVRSEGEDRAPDPSEFLPS